MQDFILDKEEDLQIKNGDLDWGNADKQQQKHILLANKGEYKKFPEIGVGVAQILNSENYAGILIEAKKNLEYDGMDIRDISYKGNKKLIVDGKYKNNNEIDSVK